MQVKRLAGPDAASRKYDILTALGCHALGADASTQRLVLRFLTLITARYNWRQNILHVGQREIARLWDVDERTVKREMAKLRALGWLALESPARRGRVASYALDLPAIHGATRAAWTRVGPDYEGRMAGLAEPEAHSDPAPSGRPAAAPDFGPTVVPFPRAEAAADLGSADPWSRVRDVLRREDPAVFASWFDALRSEGRGGDRLTLLAPSAFHATYVRTHYSERLARAVASIPGLREVRVMVDEIG